MRLDPDKLREEAEAHQVRLQSPLWSDDGGKRGEDWTAKLNPKPQPSVQPSDEGPPRQHAGRPPQKTWESFLTEDGEIAPTPPREREILPDLAAQEILPRLDALDRAVESLAVTLSRRPRGGGDASGWLETAAGNPRTYDAPDAQRTGVCVRVLPTTYAQLQQIQRKMGLRTTAGAWEFLLRLGFAAAEKLPA